MTSASPSPSSSLIRTLLIYSICVPLAVFLGYLLAQPLDYASIISLSLVLFILMIPLFLRWHHLWLIASWNLGAVVIFVPGRPYLWLAMAGISLGISVVQHIINPRLKFLSAPTVTRPLLFLVLVVLVTAKLTGGIGLGSMGSDVEGGKKYIELLGGIVAYFAIIAQKIPPKRARLCVALFFLGSLTCLIGELPAVVGPSFYFIFMVFPVTMSGAQAVLAPGAEMIGRLEGFAAAGSAVIYWMLCRYGVQELFNLRRPGRLLLFLFFGVVALFGGFRSLLVTFGITFAVLFYLEGMARSRVLPLVAVGLVLCATVVAGFSDRMPLSIQRTLSFLPLKIDPAIRMDAQESTAWRIRIWKDVLPEVPEHLLLGKGYALNAKELGSFSMGTGGENTEARFAYVGDYHSGPLSVILPLGMFGAIAFLWFLYASLRVLYFNYKLGDPASRQVNRFLFAYFICKVFSFFVLFGALSSELVTFTGLIGLSISLNGGVLKIAVSRQPKLRLQPFKFRPPIGKPIGVLPPVGSHPSTSAQ